MPDQGNRYLPLLGNGEVYIEGVERHRNGREPQYTEGFESARRRLSTDLDVVRAQYSREPADRKLPVLVMCLRIFPRFIAKSYYPGSVFIDEELRDVGSRRWQPYEGSEDARISRLIFVRATQAGLNMLDRRLAGDFGTPTEAFRKDVQKIQKISTLSADERILGFEDEWSSGAVEMVLHPLGEYSRDGYERMTDVMSKVGVDRDAFRAASYPGGPTFVGAEVTRDQLNAIADFNPLRTIHPLRVSELPDLRGVASAAGPRPPRSGERSSIVVGIFDGGLQTTNPLLANFARLSPEGVPSAESDQGVAHGTAVAGAALYGPLNRFGPHDQLETPPVSAECFRVLPPSSPKDKQLYEAIDFIERIVPQRPDISVYNLSFGPVGPILDDEITRFTYALDALAAEHKVLFVVAVGNDGHRPAPGNRVQAPADLVNGLGVGAHTYDGDNQVVRAPYSCIGWGREGAKLKPEVVAFGGCDQRPIHVVGVPTGNKVLTRGTSFSTPVVAGRIAEILGRSERVSPLLARALVVHTAEHPRGRVDVELGYGVMQSVDNVLHCSEKAVTVMYQSTLRATAQARLPIPIPQLQGFNGLVHIDWTIAALTKVDFERPDEYTGMCIEDTLYLHDSVYLFRNDARQERRIDVTANAGEADRLIAAGWARSEFPVSKAGHAYATEQQRREGMKWDTLVRKSISARYSSIRNPFLVLHAISRNGLVADQLSYAVVITVSAPRYAGNLYTDTLRVFNRLEAIQIRTRAEVMVAVS